MSDRIVRWIELTGVVVGMLLMGAGAYYGLNGRVALLEQRVSINESNATQGAAELTKRLDRLECKLDRVIEHQGQRPCN